MLGPDPRLMKKEFTRPRSHEGWETMDYTTTACFQIQHSSPSINKPNNTTEEFQSLTASKKETTKATLLQRLHDKGLSRMQN